MEITVIKRIDEFIRVNKITQNQISEKLGFTRVTYGQYRKNSFKMPIDVAYNFLQAYPEINKYWLFFGEGNMFVDDNNTLHEGESDYHKKCEQCEKLETDKRYLQSHIDTQNVHILELRRQLQDCKKSLNDQEKRKAG
jgi:transcriptional regulator with XRE-family HTH domain